MPATIKSDVLEAEEALRSSERRFRALFDSMFQFTVLLASDGTVLEINQAALAICGLTSDTQVLGTKLWEVPWPASREVIGRLREGVKKAATGIFVREEHEGHLRDGGRLIVDVSTKPAYGDDGALLYIIAEGRDVTDRKLVEESLTESEERVHRAMLELAELNSQLEQRVRERTRALEEANDELEAFCYSVSHDLRAPLRHINGYAAMLAEVCDGLVPPEAERHLRSIAEASRHMDGLIDDLLSVSRAGRSEAAEHVLDLEELIADILVGLRAGLANRAIEWEIQPLPRVLGDRAMIREAFANLLENAAKYTQPRAVARIRIGCEGEEAGRAIIVVRDNGVGFDMQYADKLFGVFQRLHHVDDFEGTGVGLANVRRIIARHGGRSWALAEPDVGASFYLTLALSGPELL